MIKVIMIIATALLTVIVLQACRINNLEKEYSDQLSNLAECQRANRSHEIKLLEVKRKKKKEIERALLIEEKLAVITKERNQEREKFNERLHTYKTELELVESTSCSVHSVRPDFVRLYQQTIANN